tara:strand:+ start:188 stop:484 length:297 start_codon:yes stop_codon:yes gene_type:complete
MSIINFFKIKKLLLVNIILSIYIAANLIGGERGLISYYEKRSLKNSLELEQANITEKLSEVKNMNELLSTKLNLDFIDMIYRDKLKYGKKDEIIIKLK